MSEVKSSGRIPSLDGLRAISIVMVLLGHARLTSNFPDILLPVAHHSLFGVRVFFVISGFLITLLLIKERDRTGTVSLRGFYIRRAFRILPAAYLVILIIAIVYRHSISHSVIVASFFYLTDFTSSPAGNLGHIWSLSVEEQFYLLWPALFLWFFPKRIPILLVAIAIAPPIRVFLAMHGHDYAAIKSFPAVEDSLAIGCLLAVCQQQLARRHRLIDRWIPLIAVVTVVLPVLHYPKYVQELFIDTLMNVGVALCIDHCIRKRYRILNSAPIVWIGGMSYSLYLCQEPFFDPHVQNWMTMFPFNLVYALIAALICRYAVEKPFLDLRSRMSARAAARASLVAAK